MGRAASRHRRRIYDQLSTAGAVSISEGVWAIPDTDFHRAAVRACIQRAEKAGGDIVVLNTSKENSPTHDVFEAALTERLAAEATALALKYENYTGQAIAGTSRGESASGEETLVQLQNEAYRLSRRDVIGLDAVASVVDRVGSAGGLVPSPDGIAFTPK